MNTDLYRPIQMSQQPHSGSQQKLIHRRPVKCSAVAEMGDRLATIDMSRKFGAVPLLEELNPHVTQRGRAEA